MATIPGLDDEVFFGDSESQLPDWRKSLPEGESDDDEPTPEERAAVVGMLGFDPEEYLQEKAKPKQPIVKPSPFKE